MIGRSNESPLVLSGIGIPLPQGRDSKPIMCFNTILLLFIVKKKTKKEINRSRNLYLKKHLVIEKTELALLNEIRPGLDFQSSQQGKLWVSTVRDEQGNIFGAGTGNDLKVAKKIAAEIALKKIVGEALKQVRLIFKKSRLFHWYGLFTELDSA